MEEEDDDDDEGEITFGVKSGKISRLFEQFAKEGLVTKEKTFELVTKLKLKAMSQEKNSMSFAGTGTY